MELNEKFSRAEPNLSSAQKYNKYQQYVVIFFIYLNINTLGILCQLQEKYCIVVYEYLVM